MARAPTTEDAFTAIAERRRRDLLGVVARHDGACDVTTLARELGWPQPQVSKHLAVLRKVGLVSVAPKGKQRMYSVNGPRLRPVYEWIRTYEQFWDSQLRRIKDRAERAARESTAGANPSEK